MLQPRATCGGRVQKAELTRTVQRHQQQQLPRGSRELSDPGGEQRLQPAAGRQRHRQRLKRGPLRIAQHRGQLQERERVALRLREHAIANIGCERGETRINEAASRLGVERPQLKLGKHNTVEEALFLRTRGSEKADPAPRHPASCVAKHPGARPIQPRQIIDDQQQRTINARPPQQCDRRI